MRGIVAALALASLAFQPRGAQREGPADVWTEREWEIRRLALDPRALQVELEAARASADWCALRAGLEALRRAVPLEPALEPALAALAARHVEDDHPNVRAAALAALAALESCPKEPLSFARDAWPEAREALAQAAAHGREPQSLAALELLLGDEDPRVARAARCALLSRPDAIDELLRLLERLELEGGLGEWLEVLEREARGRGPSPLLAALVGAGPPAGSTLDPLARRALLAAARLARGALDEELEARECEALSAGVERVSSADGLGEALEPRRRALFLAAAQRAGAPLGAALLERERASLEAPEAGLRLEAALAALGPAELVRRVQAREPPVDLASAPWRSLAALETALAARLAPSWLAPARPAELRRAGATALALGLASDGVDARALLARLDDPDPEVVRTLLRALLEHPDPRPWQGELHAAWRALPEAERLGALARLTREHPLQAFRADLLELLRAPSPGSRESSVVELLAAFAEDREVASNLGERLSLELERLDPLGPQDPERRALELWIQGLLRARARVGGEGLLDLLEHALERSGPQGGEVGKVAAALLGRLEEGRQRLARRLEPPASERVQVEAALWLALDCEPRALALLASRWSGLDAELRSRVLERLGGCDDPAGLALLEHVLLESPALRHQASALQACVARARRIGGRASAPESARAALLLLERAARDGGSLELRRRAIEALGDAWGSEALREAWRRWRRSPPSEEQALLGEELLAALARAGGADELVRGALLERPLAAAASDLARRFEGRRGTAVAFAWRGELAAAATLAERGALGPALLEDAPWWRLDGRLALELSARLVEGVVGSSAASGEPLRLAHALARLALVAFEGEAPSEDRPELLAEALARLAGLARLEGRPAEEARWLARLEGELACERVDERALLLALGASRAGDGRDPRALLATARAVDRGWRALARGERREARAQLALAELLARGSERARSLWRALEDAARDAPEPFTGEER